MGWASPVHLHVQVQVRPPDLSHNVPLCHPYPSRAGWHQGQHAPHQLQTYFPGEVSSPSFLSIYEGGGATICPREQWLGFLFFTRLALLPQAFWNLLFLDEEQCSVTAEPTCCSSFSVLSPGPFSSSWAPGKVLWGKTEPHPAWTVKALLCLHNQPRPGSQKVISPQKCEFKQTQSLVAACNSDSSTPNSHGCFAVCVTG